MLVHQNISLLAAVSARQRRKRHGSYSLERAHGGAKLRSDLRRPSPTSAGPAHVVCRSLHHQERPHRTTNPE